MSYKRSNEAIAIAKKAKPELLIKHKHQCAYCGSKEDLEIDHIIALSEGKENLQILCSVCNAKKGGKKSPGPPKRVKNTIEFRAMIYYSNPIND